MKTLIDRAIKQCGSVKVLAERLGVPANVVSMMRKGRPISPETAAELAAILGEDAGDAAILAIMERSKGTRREHELCKLLMRSLIMRKSVKQSYSRYVSNLELNLN